MLLRTFVLAVTMILSSMQVVHGEDKAVSPLESYLRAREIVEASLDAMGGQLLYSCNICLALWRTNELLKLSLLL